MPTQAEDSLALRILQNPQHAESGRLDSCLSDPRKSRLRLRLKIGLFYPKRTAHVSPWASLTLRRKQVVLSLAPSERPHPVAGMTKLSQRDCRPAVLSGHELTGVLVDASTSVYVSVRACSYTLCVHMLYGIACIRVSEHVYIIYDMHHVRVHDLRAYTLASLAYMYM